MENQDQVELCIDIDQHDSSPNSLESSMSTYDSIMQSLQDELNRNAKMALGDLGDFEDVDFFNMDCATAISFDYDLNYTMKQLKHIAGYYGMKCKSRKVDIIQDIVLFEMDDKNESMVVRRKRMFRYMETLKNDDYLKSFILL
jgi:hypothetical protein